MDSQSQQSEEKKKKDIGSILARNIWVQLFSLIRQFGILPLISPANLGLMQLVVQLANYSTLFQGGAVSALNYLFPQFLARRSETECNSLQRLTLKVVLCGTFLFIPFFWVALKHKVGTGFNDWTLPFILLLAPTPLLSNYVSASFSVRGEFQPLARIDFIVALYGMVAFIFAAFMFGINGLIFAALTPPIIRVVFGLKFFRYHNAPKWPPKTARKNLAYGTKVWLTQAATTISMTFDIFVFKALIGAFSPLLGLFAAALKIQVLLQQYITALSTVHLHRLLLLIGEKKSQNAPEVARRVTDNIALESAIATMGSLLLFAGASLTLPFIFPAYQDCTLALLALLLAVVPQRSKKYAKVLLNQDDRTSATFWLTVLQIVLTAFGYWLIHAFSGDHLFGFCLARLIVLWLISFAEVPLAFKSLQSAMAGWRFLVKLLLASLPTFVVLAAQSYYLHNYKALALFALLALPLTYAAYNVFLDGAGKKSLKVFAEILATWVKKSKRKNK